MAVRPSVPRMEGLDDRGHRSMKRVSTKGREVCMITTTGLPVAMTASSSACWWAGRSRWAREVPSPYCSQSSPSITTATSAARAVATAPAVSPAARLQWVANPAAAVTRTPGPDAGWSVGEARRDHPRQAGILGVLPVRLMGGEAADHRHRPHRGFQRQDGVLVLQQDHRLAGDFQRGLPRFCRAEVALGEGGRSRSPPRRDPCAS